MPRSGPSAPARGIPEIRQRLPERWRPARNHQLELLAREPSSVHAKISRYGFWPLWFVVVPLALCMLVVWLVKPAQDFTPITLFERFQWEVRDQQVPAYILFFTVFEM